MHKLILLLAITLLFSACRRNKEADQCRHYSAAPVSKIEGPTTGTSNQAVTLTISFIGNGCLRSGETELINQTGTSIDLRIKALNEGCACTDQLVTLQTTYQFTPATAGKYTLRFYKNTDSWTTHTIQVQ